MTESGGEVTQQRRTKIALAASTPGGGRLPSTPTHNRKSDLGQGPTSFYYPWALVTPTPPKRATVYYSVCFYFFS